jgi:hypothetical protein
MGAVRTTYAMVAACIVRRKQCIEMGLGDPFARELRGAPHTPLAGTAVGTPTGSSPGAGTYAYSQAAVVLEQGASFGLWWGSGRSC